MHSSMSADGIDIFRDLVCWRAKQLLFAEIYVSLYLAYFTENRQKGGNLAITAIWLTSPKSKVVLNHVINITPVKFHGAPEMAS